MNKPRLLREGGITQTSLKNARRLRKRLGLPIRLELHMAPTGAEWYRTRVMYDNGDSHTFTGFSWGYSGEGSRGLQEFCQNNDIPLTIKDIVKLNNNSPAMVWSWPNSPMAEVQ